MQDQPTGGEAADTRELDLERTILFLLLQSKLRGPWSIEEVGLEIGDQLSATDALNSLRAAGLVHRCQEFVFPTRAAVRFDQLADGAL